MASPTVSDSDAGIGDPDAGGRQQPGATEPASGSMADFRKAMCRYEPTCHGLPYETLSECGQCRSVAPATFLWQDGRVVLRRECPEHGLTLQLHEDAVFDSAAQPDRPGSPTHTLTGTRIQPIVRGLPRTVVTLCPECAAIILGRYFQRDGTVRIEKTCPEHGYFQDKISSDVSVFLRAAQWSMPASQMADCCERSQARNARRSVSAWATKEGPCGGLNDTDAPDNTREKCARM